MEGSQIEELGARLGVLAAAGAAGGGHALRQRRLAEGERDGGVRLEAGYRGGVPGLVRQRSSGESEAGERGGGAGP